MNRRRACVPGLIVFLSYSAFGQGLIAFSGGGGGTRDGGFQGTATFSLPLPSPRAPINAPYSGQQVHETVQTLADGTHITHQMVGPSSMTYRDSQGRVRMERSFAIGNSNLKNVPTLVQINDPASGYVYIMDDVTRVAHRIALAPGGASPSAMARRANPVPAAAGRGVVGGGGGGARTGLIGTPAQIPPNRPAAAVRQDMTPPQTSTESLGTQTIDGVLVQGTRITRVIPAGAQGNDGPITTTTDNWYSPDLQLTLLTVTTDPRSGVQTTKFANFSRAEPDPALFLAPGGYTIVDETATFTIKWGEQ